MGSISWFLSKLMSVLCVPLLFPPSTRICLPVWVTANTRLPPSDPLAHSPPAQVMATDCATNEFTSMDLPPEEHVTKLVSLVPRREYCIRVRARTCYGEWGPPGARPGRQRRRLDAAQAAPAEPGPPPPPQPTPLKSRAPADALGLIRNAALLARCIEGA